jgi:hypothetical protein
MPVVNSSETVRVVTIGKPGPPGPPGTDLTYVHNQIAASATWTVVHSLHKRPSVSIVDSGDNLVIGEVQYIDDDTLTISFTAPFSGKAYIN